MRNYRPTLAILLPVSLIVTVLCGGAALRVPVIGQLEATNPAVSVAVPSGIPLKLVKIEGPMGSPVPHYQYTLHNIGADSIMALTIKWSVYVGDDPTPRLTKLSTVDHWAGGPDSWFSPGKEKSFILTETIIGGGKTVTRMEGTPVFIEFDNGVRLGSEAEQIFARLTKRRQEMLEEFSRALAIYKASGQGALTYELAQATATPAANEGRAFAAEMVLSKMREMGTPAGIAYLSKAAELQVPL
ncbi:MAG: hypothetical protein ACRD19_07960 [Terriglobia bacterium]